MTLLTWVLLPAANIGLLYVLLIMLRKSQVLLTSVPEGHHVIIRTADDFKNEFANVENHILDKNGETRPMTPEEIKARTNAKGEFRHRLEDHTTRTHHTFLEKLLWKHFGAYYIGLPGNGNVYHMEVVKNRLRNHPQEDASSYAEKWIDFAVKPTEVGAFRHQFPRAIAIINAEMHDGSDLNLTLELIFTTVNARKATMDFPGDSVATAERITGQVVANYLRTTEGLTYQESLKTDLGENSPFVKEVMSAVNNGTTVAGPEAIQGIVDRMGLKLTGVFLKSPEPGKKTGKLSEVQVAEEIAKEEAKGVIATAEGAAKKILLEKTADAEGEAERIKRRMEAYTSFDVDPNVAAEQVGASDRREKTPNATTVVEKGSVSF